MRETGETLLCVSPGLGTAVASALRNGAESGSCSCRVPSPESRVPATTHCACIDNESLPTGMLRSSCGHSSMPTALTAAYSRASSPGWLAAAIQFADSLTWASASTGAAHRLVIASPTAMRAAAAASSSASGVRSPIAIASPAWVSNPARVIAQSASGSCHGPIICSRAVRPPTLRSPIVTRKLFAATAGCANTRSPASRRSSVSVSSSGQRGAGGCRASRCIFGGLPNSTSIGRSMGWSRDAEEAGSAERARSTVGACRVLTACICSIRVPSPESRVPSTPWPTTSRSSAVATPTAANGQRSRSQIAANSARRACGTPST